MSQGAINRRRFIRAAAGLGLWSALSSVASLAAVKSRQQTKVAVCFGSGALHGYAHIGVIRAFEHHGFKPDLICGTSVGAIVGVLWAAGLKAKAIEQLARDHDRFTFKLPRIPIFGLANLNDLEMLISQAVDHKDIESLPVEFAAIATDLDTGQLVRLTKGPVGRAVAASASIPLRYEPVVINGKRLVDGALIEPVPVGTAKALGADSIIAIDVAYRPYEEPVSGFTDVAFQMFHIMVNRLIDEQIGQADFAIRLDVHKVMQNEDVIENLIEAGERAVHEQWPKLVQSISSL